MYETYKKFVTLRYPYGQQKKVNGYGNGTKNVMNGFVRAQTCAKQKHAQ